MSLDICQVIVRVCFRDMSIWWILFIILVESVLCWTSEGENVVYCVGHQNGKMLFKRKMEICSEIMMFVFYAYLVYM